MKVITFASSQSEVIGNGLTCPPKKKKKKIRTLTKYMKQFSRPWTSGNKRP